MSVEGVNRWFRPLGNRVLGRSSSGAIVCSPMSFGVVFQGQRTYMGGWGSDQMLLNIACGSRFPIQSSANSSIRWS